MDSHELTLKINNFINELNRVSRTDAIKQIAFVKNLARQEIYKTSNKEVVNLSFWQFWNFGKQENRNSDIDVIVLEKLKRISLREVFETIYVLQRAINEFTNLPKQKNFTELPMLSQQVGDFIQSLEDFQRHKLIPEAEELIKSAQVLRSSIISASEALEVTKQIITEPFSTPIQNKDEESITIFLDCDSSILTISSRLSSLAKIYTELCRLIDVSEAQFPLKISHLEVGSIWTKIFGESKVIALMTKFFEETALYIYRNKTQEGKRKEVSTKVSEIKQLIDLESELKKNNFNTERLREDIQKSSHIISQEYCNLIANSNSVGVNGAMYNFTEDNPRGLFQNKREPLLLENKEED